MPRKIGSDGIKRRHFIKEWRKHRGLTLERLAERIGTTKQSMSRIEKGEQPYTQSSLEALADALMVEPGDLISRDPREPTWSIFDLPAEFRDPVKTYADYLVNQAKGEVSPAPAAPSSPVPFGSRRRRAG